MRLLTIVTCLFCCGVAAWAERPNVLLLYIDDLRPQTSDYGRPFMHTPNFEQLAATGVRFENAYCQVPTCGASRASLFTSLYPTVERFPNFYVWAEKDAPNVKTLPQRFKEAGYITISNGKVFHHREDTADRSWSEAPWRPNTTGRTYYNEASKQWKEERRKRFKGPKGRNARKKDLMWEAGDVDPMETHDGKIAARTMADLRRLADHDKPFFLACGFAKPHMPFYSPAETYARYPLDDIALARHRQLPQPRPAGYREVREQFAYVPMAPDLARRIEYNSEEYHRRMRQGYYASVTHVDDLAGRIFAEMDRLGLSENTIVVVLGDHGWLLGEHNTWAKNQLLHKALRTALWMKGPGVARQAEIEAHIEFVDIHPTLCELAGIAIPEAIHGKSFAKLLSQPSGAHRDDAYTRFAAGDALTSDDFFYVHWSGDNGDGELLIDRNNDPLHAANVAGDANYQPKLQELREKLQARIDMARSIETKGKVE